MNSRTFRLTAIMAITAPLFAIDAMSIGSAIDKSCVYELNVYELEKRLSLIAEQQRNIDELVEAAEKGESERVVKALQKYWINMNINAQIHNRTALMAAAEEGRTEIVKLLLGKPRTEINSIARIDINAQNRFGMTALMFAVQNGHIEVVRLLLDTNDINRYAKDESGRTALFLAADSGHQKIVRELLLAGHALNENEFLLDEYIAKNCQMS